MKIEKSHHNQVLKLLIIMKMHSRCIVEYPLIIPIKYRVIKEIFVCINKSHIQS